MPYFYLDIKMEGRRQQQIVALERVYHLLHGVFSRENSPGRIGLCFPYYHCHYEKGASTLGKVVRLCGSRAEDLIETSRTPGLLDLADYKAISIGVVQPVPDNVPHVRFVRDRSLFYTRRIDQNYYRLKQSGKLPEYADSPPNAQAKIRSYPPFVKFKSRENKGNYTFHIKMVKVDTPKLGYFNGFGLSVDGSTVPYF